MEITGLVHGMELDMYQKIIGVLVKKTGGGKDVISMDDLDSVAGVVYTEHPSGESIIIQAYYKEKKEEG